MRFRPSGVRSHIQILLKNLRSSFESLRTNGEAVEIMGDFSVHAERGEAFLGFFSIIGYKRLTDANLSAANWTVKGGNEG